MLENLITIKYISHYTTCAFYPEDGSGSFLRNFATYLTTWRHRSLNTAMITPNVLSQNPPKGCRYNHVDAHAYTALIFSANCLCILLSVSKTFIWRRLLPCPLPTCSYKPTNSLDDSQHATTISTTRTHHSTHSTQTTLTAIGHELGSSSI